MAKDENDPGRASLCIELMKCLSRGVPGRLFGYCSFNMGHQEDWSSRLNCEGLDVPHTQPMTLLTERELILVVSTRTYEKPDGR